MATQLRSPFTPFSLSSPTHKLPSTTHKPILTIRCGPRGNRGPLVKGRILSSEAIQAVQALKRAHKTNQPDPTKPLTRLIKADLLATLRELLRQGHCDLALMVFSTVRSESWYKLDLGLYSDLVLALEKQGMGDDIDRLIAEMEEEGAVVIDWGDRKGLGRLIRAVIAAGRRESTVGIYRVMKRSGWGCSGSGVEVDEYVAKVLSKGLRRFGEVDLAKEVELALEAYLKACLGRVGV